MGNLEKLRAGPFRPGRANVSDEVRQLHAETVRNLNMLRSAVLGLDSGSDTYEGGGGGRTAAFHSYCNRSVDPALFYAPWGNLSEAATGAVDEEVLLPPPFGARSILVDVKLIAEGAAGSTDVRICEADETLLQLESITLSAGVMGTVPIGLRLQSADPIIIGVNPSVGPNSFVVAVLFEEASE